METNANLLMVQMNSNVIINKWPIKQDHVIHSLEKVTVSMVTDVTSFILNKTHKIKKITFKFDNLYINRKQYLPVVS